MFNQILQQFDNSEYSTYIYLTLKSEIISREKSETDLFQLKNRDILLHYITKWYIIDQRLPEIQQLKRGLNYMGFLDTIRNNTWFEPLFVYAEQYSITASYMVQKLEPLIDKIPTKDEKQKRAKKQASLCITSIDGKYLQK